MQYKRQGSIHFIESYFITRSANVQFTVEETSDLRLSLFTEGNVDAEVIHNGMLFLGAREQDQVDRLFTPHAESGDSYPFIALTTDAFEIQRELSPANVRNVPPTTRKPILTSDAVHTSFESLGG